MKHVSIERKYSVNRNELSLKTKLLFGLLALAGCSDGTDPPEIKRDSSVIEIVGPVTRIRPGESAFVRSYEGVSLSEIKARLPEVDHHYPNGINDSGAAIISRDPMRVDVHVALSGEKTNYLDNDLGCDVLRIENVAEVKYIEAVSLGDVEDTPILSWSKNTDGTINDFVLLCSIDGNEPADGVVIFTSDSFR